MQGNSDTKSYIDIPLDTIGQEFQINNLESNNKRYVDTIESSTYSAIVTDLDGVVLEKGSVQQAVLSALSERIVNPDTGRIPLVLATGRSLGEVEKVLLNSLVNGLNNLGIPLLKGNILVFANNGAHGIDVGSQEILLSYPINQEALEEALRLDEVGILLSIRNLQLSLFQEHQLIRKKSITRSGFTYTFGVNIPQLDLLNKIPGGSEVIDRFEQLFGSTRSLFYASQIINHHLFLRGLPLEATTTGSTIDINARGINKGTAIKYISEAFEMPANQILSIGDSVYGNDMPLTQREGGFVNVPTIIPGNPYPIYIAEEGDQFQRVVQFLNRVKLQGKF